MADTNHDDYWGDSASALGGGFLTDYTGIIRDPEFGTDPDYNSGQTLRFMFDTEITVQPDPDIQLEPGDVINRSLNIGDVTTYEALDGGQRVGKVDGTPFKAHRGTDFGRLVTALYGGSYGDEDATRLENREELIEVFKGRKGHLDDASLWDGLEFEFTEVRFSATFKDGTTNEWGRTFPARFIGVADDSAAAPASNGAAKVDGEVLESLKQIAKDAGDHNTFLAKAMQAHPGIHQDPEHGASVLDTSGDGLYAQANA